MKWWSANQGAGASLLQQLEGDDGVRDARANYLRDVTSPTHSVDVKHISVCYANKPRIKCGVRVWRSMSETRRETHHSPIMDPGVTPSADRMEVQ